MVALNPAAVEPKFRPIAYCLVISVGLCVAGKVGHDLYSAHHDTSVVSSRLDYGPLPNFWLCHWSDLIDDHGKVEPVANYIKVPGTWALAEPIAEVFSAQRPWAFPSHGGPKANGECAFFQTSMIVNPGTDLFVKLEANLELSGDKAMRQCAVYADSPAADGQEAWQSEVGWVGASAHSMPLLYTTIFKRVVGTQDVFGQEKHPEYTGAVRGIYDIKEDLTADVASIYKVNIWLQVITTTGGVSGVTEYLRQSELQKLLSGVATLGGVFAIVGALFSMCFVQKHPGVFQLTLRTPAYHIFAKEAYSAQDESNKHITADDFFKGTCLQDEEDEEEGNLELPIIYPQGSVYPQRSYKAER